MKRRFLSKLMVVALALSFVFTGCGKQADTSENETAGATTSATTSEVSKAPAEPVTIEVLHGEAEEARMKVFQSIMDEFTAKNPEITVKQMPVPEDGFWTKISTLMSAGNLPAIVDGSIDQMRLMNIEGVLDTASNAVAINTKGKDAFYKGALDLLKLEDKDEYIGVPISGWVAGIWYRKDLFAEKGLATPDTWENILAAAKAFNDPGKKKYGIAFATEESDFTEQTFAQIALSNNALLFDDSGKPTFNSPEMKEAVQFYKDLYQYSPKGSNGVTQVKDAFVGENAAMCMYSTYIMSALYDQKIADKIGFAIPTKKSAAGFGMTSTMTVINSVKPEERAAAAKYIAYQLETDVNITRLHMSPGGANPVIKDIAANEKYTSHELIKAFGETATKVPEAFNELKMFGFQNGKTNPKMGNVTAKFIIPKALNAILVQDANIDDEIAKAQKAIEEEVK